LITELATAITNLYDSASGAALRAVNTGGLYFQDADQSVTLPYTVFMWGGSSTDDRMGTKTDKIELADINFNTYSKADDGGTEAAQISGLLQNLFDEASLSLAGSFTSLRVQRTGTSIFFTDDVWQITNLYTIWIDW
jgi:hypothetical protein